ncbi:MAG: hypothetical protein J2P37_28255 [Ktedonobacteraceae bacterium]|nr:hypothetical protein [Ktedonobacteraceae bacterium]
MGRKYELSSKINFWQARTPIAEGTPPATKQLWTRLTSVSPFSVWIVVGRLEHKYIQWGK